jgi:hypothetical protein
MAGTPTTDFWPAGCVRVVSRARYLKMRWVF